jgi:hypothetical protein
MAIAALDSDRGLPAERVFRRVGPVARELRPKNGGRLAFVACISLGRNPRRSCGDHACVERRSLGRSRLCADAHPLLVAELLSSIIQPLQIKRGKARATRWQKLENRFLRCAQNCTGTVQMDQERTRPWQAGSPLHATTRGASYMSKLAIVTTTLLAISPDRLDRGWRSENLAPEARDR